jgi:hypothetical protein
MFNSGFEKISYDYAHEVRKDIEYRKKRAKENPVDKTTSSLVGAGLGGVLGAGVGATAGRYGRLSGKGALIGGAIGAGLGGLGGLLAHYSDAASIEHAKRINKMPPKQKKEYLASLARDREISEREANEESRHQRAMMHHRIYSRGY